jgi:hypothetical protein
MSRPRTTVVFVFVLVAVDLVLFRVLRSFQFQGFETWQTILLGDAGCAAVWYAHLTGLLLGEQKTSAAPLLYFERCESESGSYFLSNAGGGAAVNVCIDYEPADSGDIKERGTVLAGKRKSLSISISRQPIKKCTIKYQDAGGRSYEAVATETTTATGHCAYLMVYSGAHKEHG